MILSRRKAHLVYFVVLAILLPILFIAGVVLRPVYGPSGADIDSLFSQVKKAVFANQVKRAETGQNPVSVFLKR